MYLCLCPHLVPHRFESHADDGIKALKLGIPHVEVVQVKILLVSLSLRAVPRSDHGSKSAAGVTADSPKNGHA